MEIFKKNERRKEKVELKIRNFKNKQILTKSLKDYIK